MANRLLLASAIAALATTSQAQYISVNASTANNLDWVQVSFGGLDYYDAKYAWIGVYAAGADTSSIEPMSYPATAPWTTNAPLKFIYLYQMNNTVGYGSWNFELINVYQDIFFSLFTGGIENPTEVARTNTVSFPGKGPLRGRLARTGSDPTSMQLTWNSPFNNDNAKVKYGTSSGVYTNTASASANTYTVSDMCGDPGQSQGWFDPKYFQTAVMTGLTPGQRYYYVYGSDANGYSTESSFVAAPQVGANQALSMLVYADMGMTEYDGCKNHWAEPQAGETAQHMIDLATAGKVSLGLHVGDIAYATGYEAKWYLFDERMSVLGRQIPVMMGLGNHERDWPGTNSFYDTSYDSGGECGVPAMIRYPMPWSPSDPRQALDSSWYAFSHGPAYIVMLNSELPVDPSSAQYAFLSSALAKVDRTKTPWVFVAFHRPMYYSLAGPQIDPNFEAFEQLLYSAQVDMVLTGHVHYAMATCPVFNGTCMSPSGPTGYDGPVHVVIGHAGQTLTPAEPTGGWINFLQSAHGYSVLNIEDKNHMWMGFYDDDTNSLQYKVTITRTR